MHEDLALCWRVEEACQLAWPALHAQHLGGYILRYSGSNRSRRANSLNPLNGPRARGTHFVSLAEGVFDHFNMRACFRLPDIANELDVDLASLGYQREAETITLFASDFSKMQPDRDVYVAPNHVPASWLDFYFSQSDEGEPQRKTFQDMLGKIAMPCAFGQFTYGNEVAAIAYVVAVDGIAIIESVATHPDFRRKGMAQKTINSLLAWAATKGCTAAALQVVAENEPATTLYTKLGFSKELYRYHYRVKK
ncbi:ribosomal-protein-alanine N-acetyltransferase [Maritalea myrionectae]|uniref:Ribosomal-protein-alanine N-acetyltransferase n=1 Tax=Maritalea myrionectae TaxID=454601 RepID=A0A2R4M9B6_9HYPH|nr:GNAT family N-acetyltransferase [Maritalea myrionectae]AVX02563.1 ribosomal-protein-alanine N-acetyltransferase [Maritalea myrionectae]